MRAIAAAALFSLFAPMAVVADDAVNAAAAPAGEQAFSDAQEAALGAFIRAYLLENPEILEEAYAVLIERREAEQAAAQALAVQAERAAIYADPRDFSVGPADAKVTIVEFFDYTCGWCKRSVPWVQKTLATYPDDVRFIFKEMPREAAGATAQATSKASLATIEQNKYLEFHFALMQATGELTGPRIDEIAKSVGVNVKELRKEMAQPGLREHLESNVALAERLGVDGTPAFIVNDTLVHGADFEQLQALIDAALSEG